MRHLLILATLIAVVVPTPALAQFTPLARQRRSSPPPIPMTSSPRTEVSLLVTLNPNNLGTGVRVTRNRNDVAAWELNLERAFTGGDTTVNGAAAGRLRWRRGPHPEAGGVFATAGIFVTGTHDKVWSPLYGIGLQSDYRDGVAVRTDIQSLPRLCDCRRLGIGVVMGF